MNRREALAIGARARVADAMTPEERERALAQQAAISAAYQRGSERALVGMVVLTDGQIPLFQALAAFDALAVGASAGQGTREALGAARGALMAALSTFELAISEAESCGVYMHEDAVQGLIDHARKRVNAAGAFFAAAQAQPTAAHEALAALVGQLTPGIHALRQHARPTVGRKVTPDVLLLRTMLINLNSPVTKRTPERLRALLRDPEFRAGQDARTLAALERRFDEYAADANDQRFIGFLRNHLREARANNNC